MNSEDKSKAWKENFDIQKALTSYSDVKVVFDVGAYDGGTGLKYSDTFPGATVYCFEPFMESYNKLEGRVGNTDTIKVFNTAISNIDGEVTLNCNKSELTNSIFESETTGTKIDSYTETEQSCPVNSITLDTFCNDNDIESIDILKMDIQGAELAALYGASNLLKKQNIKLLFLEVEFIKIYKDQPLYQDIATFLYNKGYSLYDFRGMSYTEAGQLAWADAIFCSKEIAANIYTL